MNWLEFTWLVLGVFGWFICYHSARKEWYMEFKEEYWTASSHMGLNILCIIFPIYICAGPITLNKYHSLYFNIKRYERKQLLKKKKI